MVVINLFVFKSCACEYQEPDPVFKTGFLDEMALAAEAAFHAFRPDERNVEAFGNDPLLRTGPHAAGNTAIRVGLAAAARGAVR